MYNCFAFRRNAVLSSPHYFLSQSAQIIAVMATSDIRAVFEIPHSKFGFWPAIIHRSPYRHADVHSFFVIDRAYHAGAMQVSSIVFTLQFKIPDDLAESAPSEVVEFQGTSALRLQMDMQWASDPNRTFMPPMTTEISRDSEWIQSALEGAVLSASVPGLKLYHVLDLIRLVYQVAWGRDTPFPQTLPISIAAILRPFVSEYCSINLETARKHAQLLLAGLYYTMGEVRELFYRRWESSKVKNDVQHAYIYYDSKGSGACTPAKVILSLPSDGLPLFYFTEGSHYFRPRLNAITLPNPRVLTLRLSEFTTHIRGSSDPLEAHARIVALQRWQCKTGLRHQFILLHCIISVVKAQLFWSAPHYSGMTMWGLETNEPLDFWLRIERPAHLQSFGAWGVSSIFPPDDRVLVAYSPRYLVNPAESTGTIPPELLNQIQHKESTDQPRVRELAKILDIFQAITTSHILLKDNCYYLAPLLEELVGMGNSSPQPSTSQKGCSGLTWATFAPGSTGDQDRVLKLWKINESSEELKYDVVNIPPDAIVELVQNASLPMASSRTPPAGSQDSGSSPASFVYQLRNKERFVRSNSVAQSRVDCDTQGAFSHEQDIDSVFRIVCVSESLLTLQEPTSIGAGEDSGLAQAPIIASPSNRLRPSKPSASSSPSKRFLVAVRALVRSSRSEAGTKLVQH
ncbi:hypothetical protein DL93DRAFT_1177988 [Clavulina sp. PMI_390]|nr:hypothetical protein DL93DRAFT_1177988 [Clavulina sp. PMI_390]